MAPYMMASSKTLRYRSQAHVNVVFSILVAHVSICCLSACGLLKPPPDDTKGVQNWLVIPVFYATNRTFAGAKSTINYSEVPNGKGLLFGVKNIAVPMPVYSPIEKGTEEKMLWQLVHENQAAKGDVPAVNGSTCPVPDATLDRDTVVQAFDSYMKQTHSKEAVIFVHGCCATFDTSMKRAARVSAHMQVPVLVYDWVSPQGFTKYLENETLARQTLDDFCRFLSKVEKRMNPGQITLLGHSMGALFIDEAMVRRSVASVSSPAPPQRYGELVMSNADVDAKTFLNHAQQFADNAIKSRIYISHADSRLRASAVAHGGFYRLGEPGPLLTNLTKVGGQELIDITANNSGHELPYWIIANLHKYGNLGPVKEYQLNQESPSFASLVLTGIPKPEAVSASADPADSPDSANAPDSPDSPNPDNKHD